MNPRYKNGILVFGAIVPLLLLIVIFGFLSSKKASVVKEYDSRLKVQTANLQAEKAAAGVEAQLQKYKVKKRDWDTLLKSSDVGSVTGLLKDISSKYKAGDKFKQKDFAFVDRATGIGAASKQNSVTYNISVTGTYQALQESLLSLESRLPNLSLNSIGIKPQDSGQLLEAEISYSAWIN
ncbi:MAG: hypothetical protein ACSHYB_13450 [Roseibacillus sp.]